MRIVILSIALLFCAFSAHSQVLKSAGVWYFLDVDSMTARPAVLPNGTELAYVIGTKKIYYWDRGTSTWTEYSTGSGSTFNRDSIYFDASIVGSGTVGDPWGVDSTLFATIAGVGDSITNALLGYLPIEGGTLTGTGGAGFIGFPSQVSAPGTPASGLNVFASGSAFTWKGTDGHERQFASTLTGGRTYTLPDVSGTFALGTGTADRSARWSATNTLAAGNFTDNGTKVQALLPFQFQTYTTAGLPTGVTGYYVYNTTTNGLAWYQGSRWAYGLESTFNRGTATRIPFFDVNGQISDVSTLRYNYANGYLYTPNFISPKIETYPNDVWFLGGSNANRIRFYTPTGTDNLMYFYVNNVYVGQFTAGTTQFAINHTNSLYLAQQGGILPYVTIGGSGVSIGNGASVGASYPLHIQGASTIGLGRGAVSSRPTIAASTTPFWYNTDSTALEYGESVGTWRQLATRAYARSLVSGLPTVNIYTGDGNLGDNVTRTFSQGSNGDFIQYRTTTTDKRHKTYLSVPGGSADYDDEARVLYQSGGTKNRKISHYKAGGIYGGIGTYLARYQTSERNSADNYVLDEIYASMGSGSNANFAGVLVGADSTNLNTISALKMITENAASKRTHWAGLIDNSYGNGGWGSLGNRFISYSPSYKIQTNFFNSNTYFDWIRIDNLDTDTTSHRISFYNNKYAFPNSSPSTTSGVVNVLKWTGTGSAATPSLGLAPNIYNENGTITGARDVNYSGTSSNEWTIQGTNNAKVFSNTFESSNTNMYTRERLDQNYYPGTGYDARYTMSSQNYSGTRLDLDQDDNFTNTFGSTKNGYMLRRTRYNTGNNQRFSSFLNGVDSVSGSVGAVMKFRSQTGTSAPWYHWAGFVNVDGFGSQLSADERYIAYSPSFKVQTQKHATNTYFDWIRIDNLDTDTTSNRISLYNGKYPFKNGTPGTGSNVHVWDNGTPSFKEIKRDTTIFLTADTDYNLSTALEADATTLTTAEINSRYNRIIIHMTLTSGVGADKTTTLHTPDANLMQCEILIRGTDNTGTYDNEIAFGTNNAISSDGTNTSGYTLAQGQGLHVRVVYNGSAYKYIYY